MVLLYETSCSWWPRERGERLFFDLVFSGRRPQLSAARRALRLQPAPPGKPGRSPTKLAGYEEARPTPKHGAFRGTENASKIDRRVRWPGSRLVPDNTASMTALSGDRCGPPAARSGQVRVSHGETPASTRASSRGGRRGPWGYCGLTSCDSSSARERRHHVKAGHMTFLGGSHREDPRPETSDPQYLVG